MLGPARTSVDLARTLAPAGGQQAAHAAGLLVSARHWPPACRMPQIDESDGEANQWSV